MLRRCHRTGLLDKVSSTTIGLPPSFRVVLPIRVAWGDMDAFNHVNNCVFVKYLEHSRVRYFEEIGMSLNVGSKPEISAILAGVSCRFRRPVTYPDELMAGCRLVSFDAQRGDFKLEHALWSTHQKAVVATGESACVTFNYVTQQRTPIPAQWIDRISQVEQRAPQDFPPHVRT